MDNERGSSQNHSQHKGVPELQRTYHPHRQAMLAALRIVLDLPRSPTPLNGDEE